MGLISYFFILGVFRNVGSIGVLMARIGSSMIEILNAAFRESERLTRERKLYLAWTTGLDMEQVSRWFSRKRARKRADEFQRTISQLRESLLQSQEQENNLREQLQESRARQAVLENENQLLKQRIADLECESRFGWFINGHP